ncbi:MAG TPA: hypothetical protein VFZ16_18565 [Hyphomicrobiaceae bacterium]|nr:hypothetical protein [Hyphomicrobiaceae bacterium]
MTVSTLFLGAALSLIPLVSAVLLVTLVLLEQRKELNPVPAAPARKRRPRGRRR